MDINKNYIMDINFYPQDLVGFVKLLNNYIVERGNNRNFRKVYGKEHIGVAFTQTQEKDANDKKKNNNKGESHWFHCRDQDHWVASCTDLDK